MDERQALAFCEILYGHDLIQDAGLQIEVCSITPGKKGKLSYTFCQTTQAAADAAIRIAGENNNAYACMSLVNPKTIKTKRGTAKDSKAIVGFWSDIDIADPMAPKPGKNPPVNVSEALAIAKGVGATPSLIVHSGHGVHAYWLFDTPWIFEDDDERKFAGDVAKAWHQTLQQVARDRGRTLDSVFDLARVLRIPGTINTKVEVAPLDVKIIWPPKPEMWTRVKRYGRGELESLIRAPSEGTEGEVVKPEKLKTVEFRFPNELERAKLESKIMIACMNDRTFKDTWERTRLDFASSQHSASEYDMSLANQMTSTGWADQDIYWVLLLWREKHGEDTEKIIKRADYVELTIAKAKKGNTVVMAAKEIDNLTAEVKQLQTKHTEAAASPEIQQQINDQLDTKRQDAFATVSKLIGAELTDFHRDGEGKEANYYLKFGDKDCLIGDDTELLNIRHVRPCIYREANIILGKITEVDWWGAIQLLTSFRTENVNPSLTSSERWLAYLLGYIERAPHIANLKADPKHESRDNKRQCLLRRQPYWEMNGTEESLFFHLESFKNHAQKYYADRTPHDEINAAMRAIGAEPRHVHQKVRGKKLHRYLWTLTKSAIDTQAAHIDDGLLTPHTVKAESDTTEEDQ